MALFDLSRVTSTLITLLRENISVIAQTTVTVTPQPPESLSGVMNTLSLHLYHVAEDQYYKNVLGPGMDIPNVARAPMAIDLFYILTAHHETEENPEMAPLIQQNILGYALKTFHDIPVITDDTQVGATQILDSELRGRDNNLQVILRPVSPEDAVSFWSAEEQQTARLSAYYEVRVVMFEPEEPTTMSGIVLHLGTFLVQLGTPHLECSQNTVHFQIPARNGGTMQEVESTPARVTLNTSLNPPAVHNTLRLLGTNLTAGRSQSLVLKSALWERLPAAAGGPAEEVVVDPILNDPLGWRIAFATDQVEVTLAPTLSHAGNVVDLPMFPGSYTASVRTVMDEKVINNELKQIRASSNAVGFTVAPRLASHSLPAGNNPISIDLGPEFDPLDPNIPPELIELQVIVDGVVYTRVNTNPPPNPAEFVVTSTTIIIRPAFTVAPDSAHPFRLIVNGAESAPFWIEVP